MGNLKEAALLLKKISTNPVDAYSMLNPETNSDSPSEKSKGVRLVSAKSSTNHIIVKHGREILIIAPFKICSLTL